MKKFKFLLLIMIFTLTGCLNNDTMDNINISTSVYPIEYVVNVLYGNHSTIRSIYPNDSEVLGFEVTDILLKDYSDSEMFIFNGLTDEKNHVKTMLNNNSNLKIIDVTSNMVYDYSMEELWLDPNNLLTIANNIKKGFEEYISSTYLVNEIKDNYETLKIDLTNLDGKYYSASKNSKNPTIIVSDDAFKYLEKYGIKVISLDLDTMKEKDLNTAKELVNNNTVNYLFIKYGEELSDELNSFINETKVTPKELYTMTNLHDINVEKMDYVALMNQNLENIKLELYK